MRLSARVTPADNVLEMLILRIQRYLPIYLLDVGRDDILMSPSRKYKREVVLDAWPCQQDVV